MNPALLTGQEMDEGLEEMWTESVQNISRINPCKSSVRCSDVMGVYKVILYCYHLFIFYIFNRFYPAAENWKIQTLPLARIKKIMKSEEFILQELEKEKQQKAAEEGQPVESEKSGVKFMISGEAPVLMSKACELLIRDLSFRAWRHTERNRRRTLQRQDLHAAVGESEVYDFLIDIVPRVSTSKSSPGDASVANAQAMVPQIPQGLPHMTGLPTVAQPMAAPPPVAPMNALMDNNGMQQMQHSTTAPQPQQLQQGMVQQFADQQQPQHFQSFMPVPQLPSDNGQGVQLTTINSPPATQAPQQIQQWMTQPVASTSNTSQPG